MTDWWSKKLGGQQPTPQRTYQTPPLSAPVHIPASVPMSSPMQAERQDVLDPSRPPTENLTMGEALRLWKGGEAMRKEGNMTCPDCGSIYVFSRTGRGSNSMINGHSPAPRCYECGWNGMYDQATPRG